MRVLFVGDSPTVNTGFSRCTREVCNSLISSGYEVVVLGMGYAGDPHSFPYPIYPCVNRYDKCVSYGGEDRLPIMISRVNPDIVVILQDTWNIGPYFEQLDKVKEVCDKDNILFTIPPIVGWVAVDSKNQKAESLNRLAHVVVWTKFAGKELVKGGYGGGYSVIPLGVDTDIFYPRDKQESRREIFGDLVPLDAYIVGVVGRNQPRKRLDLTLEYFAEWVNLYSVSNAYLYLHVAPTGERSCDIRSLIDYYKLNGRVIINEPQVGLGNDESLMPTIYSCLDLHITQSQAEGWHLPTLEAMACGVPNLVPDHSCFSANGWCRDAVVRVKCSASALTAPLNGYPYTIGLVPDKEDTIIEFQNLYKRFGIRNTIISRGLDLAHSMTWKRTAESFCQVLESTLQLSNIPFYNEACATCGLPRDLHLGPSDEDRDSPHTEWGDRNKCKTFLRCNPPRAAYGVLGE